MPITEEVSVEGLEHGNFHRMQARMEYARGGVTVQKAELHGSTLQCSLAAQNGLPTYLNCTYLPTCLPTTRYLQRTQNAVVGGR